MEEAQYPQYEPDITSLVVFGTSAPKHISNDGTRNRLSMRYGASNSKLKSSAKKKLPMRVNAQRLIMQNYERIKQAMLIGLDTKRIIF